jgi:hypothetical protein
MNSLDAVLRFILANLPKLALNQILLGMFVCLFVYTSTSASPKQSHGPTLSIFHCLLITDQVGPLSQPFNNKIMSLSSTVNILNIIRSRLEMTCCIVTLGDEDIVIDTAL